MAGNSGRSRGSARAENNQPKSGRNGSRNGAGDGGDGASRSSGSGSRSNGSGNGDDGNGGDNAAAMAVVMVTAVESATMALDLPLRLDDKRLF